MYSRLFGIFECKFRFCRKFYIKKIRLRTDLNCFEHALYRICNFREKKTMSSQELKNLGNKKALTTLFTSDMPINSRTCLFIHKLPLWGGSIKGGSIPRRQILSQHRKVLSKNWHSWLRSQVALRKRSTGPNGSFGQTIVFFLVKPCITLLMNPPTGETKIKTEKHK